MTLRNFKTIYKDKKVLMYSLLSSIAIIIFAIISIFITNNICLSKLTIVSDINGINYVTGFVAVMCCILYYHIYKDDEFYIFILNYIAIYLEYLIISSYVSKNIINICNEVNFLWISYLFRIFILYLAVNNKSKMTKLLVKYKRFAIFSTIVLSVLSMGAELTLIYNSINIMSYNATIIIKWILILIYYILLIFIGMKYFNNKKLIYLIMFISLSILNLRKALLSIKLYNSYNDMIEFNRCLVFVGFLIVTISLFLEIIKEVKENILLNNRILMNEKEYEKLKEIESLRNEFFANISHELRTPINIIYSCNQLLHKQKEQDKEEFLIAYNKYENTIKQNCFRMLRLVSNLIDITKFDAGFLKMNFVNYEIVSLVENITLSIAKYIEAKKINIIFDTDVEELVIKCDPENIERVILNLLSNAVKFTSKNGHIVVSLSSSPLWVTISVKDDGIGIPEKFKNNIFERFIQADKSLKRNVEGSGIGLSLVKSIITLHEGNVYLGDEIKKGTEFIIKLPNKKMNDDCKEPNIIDDDDVITRVSVEFSDIYDIE